MKIILTHYWGGFTKGRKIEVSKNIIKKLPYGGDYYFTKERPELSDGAIFHEDVFLINVSCVEKITDLRCKKLKRVFKY